MVKKLIFILAIILIKNFVRANPNNGFPYISLALNARDMACGETGSAGEFFLSNPAAIPKNQGTISLSHYFLNSNSEIQTFAVEYFSYQHLTKYQQRPLAMGLDFLFQHEEPIPEYDEWNIYRGEITIQNYSLGINLSHQLNSYLNAGATIRYFLKNFSIPSLGTTRGESIGIDLGFSGEIKQTQWGLSYQNLGPKIHYSPAEEREDDLPRQMRLGIARNIWKSSEELLDVRLDLFWADADGPRLHLGSQYSWQDILFLRLGYANKESTDGAIAGFTGGLGIKIKNISLEVASGIATAIGRPVLVSLIIQ